MATISTTISLIDDISGKLSKIQSAVDDVVGSFGSLESSLSTAQTNANNFSWSKFISNCETAGKKIADVGEKMTLAFTLPEVMLGKKMYNASTSHESAFTGVKKTTDATEEEYAAIEAELYDLSELKPTGFVELSGIAEMAGQLGVAKDELVGFTSGYADIQESTNIQGAEGAESLAQFLNLTEQTTTNVRRVGGVIVDLGNKFATTESEILAMATRMAATGDLAGFTSWQILGLSTALTSAGIKAEAGGSAAGKLMKQMQMAAEVGTDSWQSLIAGADEFFGTDFSSIHDLQMALDPMTSSAVSDFAASLGWTKDELESYMDVAQDLEYFAEVSGKTAKQFKQDWANDPAQSMLDFFVGLGNLDETSGESAIAKLQEMGITEIRLSNLVAAMAGNSELYSRALDDAFAAYMADVESNPLAVEAGKRYSTQESQNEMLGNKLENTMANFGDNLVTALQPALDCVNNLLDSFNSLSETDQTKIIELLGALALTGPTLVGVGKTVEAVGKISEGIKKIIEKGPEIAEILSNPATWGVAAAGAGILLLAATLDNIPSKLDGIIESAADIQISFDQESVDAALGQIEQIQSALDMLNGNAATEDAKATSEAVKRGWGTDNMFNTGLAYESAFANNNIEQINADYAAQIMELEDKIKHSQDGEQNAIWFEEIKGLEAARDLDVSEAQRSYSAAISELFNGMAAQYPEAAKVLEEAASQYDLLGTLVQAQNFDWSAYEDDIEGQVAWDSLMERMYSQAFDLGYMKDSGFDNKEDLLAAMPMMNNDLQIRGLFESVAQDLSEAAQTVADTPILSNFLQTILQSDSVMENLDLTSVQGAFDGIIEALDFASAAQKAAESGHPEAFGEYLTTGLADGMTATASVPAEAATAVGDGTISALANSLGVNSPSIYAIEDGNFVDEGLAQGITEGTPVVIAAVTMLGSEMLMIFTTIADQIIALGITIPQGLAMGITTGTPEVIGAMTAMGNQALSTFTSICNSIVSTGNSILSYGAGYSMGANIGMGIAAGLRSQIGNVQAAASALASAAASATRSRLKIHSPSRVFYEYGELSGEGYVNALYDMQSDVEQAAGSLFDVRYQAPNRGIWDNIQLFGGYEIEDLMNATNKDYKMKVNDADMKKIRELAEREAINQFTTAELHIDFTANNNIESNLDLDGVVSYLEDQVAERLEMVAEGVYD